MDNKKELDDWLVGYLERRRIERIDELEVARSLHGEEGYYRTLAAIKAESDAQQAEYQRERDEAARVKALTDEEAVAELRALRSQFSDLARRVVAKGLRIEYCLMSRGRSHAIEPGTEGFNFEVSRVIKP